MRHIRTLSLPFLLACITACHSNPAGPQPPLDVSVAGTLTVVPGNQVQVPLVVTVTDLAGAATLAVSGTPSDVQFSPTQFALTDGTQTLTVTCSVAASVAPASYPLQVTIRAGGHTVTRSVSLVVSPIPPGSLTVSVSEPAGVSFTPNVAVLDAQGSVVGTVTQVGDTTFDPLEPGAYTIQAGVGSDGAFNYAGTVIGSPATVTSGKTAQASVAYAPSTGSLAISVQTSADGITPSVELRDTNGTVVETITATGLTAVRNLPPGTYSIVPADVTETQYTYSAIVSGSAQVEAGTEAQVSVYYQPVDGAIVLTVNAPDGVTPDVEVRDENNTLVAEVTQTGTTSLGHLASGQRYTLVAKDVYANTDRYVGSVVGGQPWVSLGQETQARVDYAVSAG